METSANGKREHDPSIFSMAGPGDGGSSTSLVDLDPDLFRGVPPSALGPLRNAVPARLLKLDAGLWRPQLSLPADAALGVLVIDGLLTRNVDVGGEVTTELIGPGDVIRPWESTDDDAVVPYQVSWMVIQPARVAILGRHIARAAATCPELLPALLDRALRRTRSQGILAAIAHFTRIDLKIVVLLWHLAERWGRVTPEGVVVPLRLTHQRLGSLIGAQRPSVTAALSRLSTRGLVHRLHGHGYLLTDEANDELGLICREGERAVAPLIAAAG